MVQFLFLIAAIIAMIPLTVEMFGGMKKIVIQFSSVIASVGLSGFCTLSLSVSIYNPLIEATKIPPVSNRRDSMIYMIANFLKMPNGSRAAQNLSTNVTTKDSLYRGQAKVASHICLTITSFSMEFNVHIFCAFSNAIRG